MRTMKQKGCGGYGFRLDWTREVEGDMKNMELPTDRCCEAVCDLPNVDASRPAWTKTELSWVRGSVVRFEKFRIVIYLVYT